jgi:gluconokinase
MVIILMGVAGSGKSTIGAALAHHLGWPFCDGDDVHPPANREKMRRGVPLTDEDRAPWLNAIRAIVAAYVDSGANAVVACSALKTSYRKCLTIDAEAVCFVYLKGPREVIENRLAARRGHFFDPQLLNSQFRDLEEPADATVVDFTPPPEAVAKSIIVALHL